MELRVATVEVDSVQGFVSKMTTTVWSYPCPSNTKLTRCPCQSSPTGQHTNTQHHNIIQIKFLLNRKSFALILISFWHHLFRSSRAVCCVTTGHWAVAITYQPPLILFHWTQSCSAYHI